MQFWNGHQRGATLRRRWTVVVMVCAYLLTAFGVPVSARVDKSGEAFPCQHHACGCQSADQCWDDCCCYSKAEKLAWAKKRGIRPPEPTIHSYSGHSDQAGHAHHSHSPQANNAERNCCKADKTPRACCSAGTNHDHSDPAEPNNVPRVKASKCRSIATMWCVQGGSMPPPTIGWQFEWISVEWLRTFPGSLNSLDRVPPVPPPRV